MKRRLIQFDVFERMQKDSLSTAEAELRNAADVLAETLGIDALKLNHFGPDNVLYESTTGDYVHANYQVKKDNILFENVEQLVVDEETEKQESRKILEGLLENILEEDKEEEANELFNKYCSLPSTRRQFNERKQNKKKDTKHFNESVRRNELLDFAIQHARGPVKNWSSLCKNVYQYVEFAKNGPVLQNTQVKHVGDDIVAVRVPTTEAANQKRLLQLKYDHMLDTEVEVKRNKAHVCCEDVNFCKACNELKRHNALSDNDALEESLEKIVGTWPELIYLTQNELAGKIKEALEIVKATNYDDQTCEFMAEGILRTAHSIFAEKVNKVYKLAGEQPCDDCDAYEDFQRVAEGFYQRVDENLSKEIQVYSDLYETLKTVYEGTENNAIKVETAGHLNELAAVLQREVNPDVRVVEAAAGWLLHLIETNLSGGDWSVSNKPHHTVSGDHPEMSKKARHPYSPASDASGDWGDPAPVSDGKSYKGGLADEMRNRGGGNWASGETFPELHNPYIPKPFGDFTIKGEKGVDKAGDAVGQWGDSNTWPALQNPYVPKGETPGSYKMNLGKEQDLVVDQ
jgi:hypothetical protein